MINSLASFYRSGAPSTFPFLESGPEGVSPVVRKGRFKTLSIEGKTFLRRSEVEEFRPSPRRPEGKSGRHLMSEYKANKTYPQFYPQLAVPPATTSDLQRRVAPLSRFNHC